MIAKTINQDVIAQRKDITKKRRLLFLKRAWNNKMFIFGGGIILILTILAVLAPVITQFTPYEIEPIDRLQAPSMKHLFGTDDFGRDLFSRVIYGTRVSLAVGIAVAAITGFFGLCIGMYASYYKTLDHILMRIADGFMSFPSILLAIAIMAVMGPTPINVVIAIVVVETPGMARIVRSSSLVVKEQTFIEAAKAQGAKSKEIIWKHIAPNVLTPLIVQITYVFSVSMIIEASLSFLGAGIPVPEPSWGNILFDGKNVIQTAWWMTVFPGVFLLLAVLGSNLLGDGLRDLLDPHSNKAK